MQWKKNDLGRGRGLSRRDQRGAKRRSMGVSLAHHRGAVAVAAIGSDHNGGESEGSRAGGGGSAGPAAWATHEKKKKTVGNYIRPLQLPLTAPWQSNLHVGRGSPTSG